MAANRYGRIYHSDHHYINLRFASVDARREFAKKFEAYHASHDHDGEPPRFEDTAASVIGNPEANRVHDAHSVSMDGYATYEIEDYHNPTRWNTYNQSRYRPPTCCVAPLISVNRTFVDSSELTRHELSAIFMDMPDEDFQNLLKSVEAEGFKDPIIRMIDEQVLDGWHRYRAAKELNLLRKLRFQQWDEKDEGDPYVFVMARNIHRRHYTPGQRAQVIVEANNWLERGDADSQKGDPSNDGSQPKSTAELAKETKVGTRTIERAKRVSQAGRADEVISGEKTAGQVITEETIKSLWEEINPAISEWKKDREGVGHASKSMFIKASLRWEGLPSDTKTDVKVLKILLNLLTTTETNILEELVRKQLSGKSLWDDAEETEATEQQATEQPQQTAEEREANTDLKRKQQAVKSIWDKRIEAARDYTGDADSELNLNVTLPELEKGFVKSEEHAYCADAFQSAIRRTSETSFNICLEKTLSSDVSLEALSAEYKALSTYALDILQWKRQAWIQQLIDKKKAKAEPPAEPEPDMDALWEAFNKRLPKWKAKYAESGYKENDLIQAATEAELFDAYRIYRESDQTGEATAEEIADLTDLMKRASYPYAHTLRNMLRDNQNAGKMDTDDTETDLETALNALMEAVAKFDECFLHDSDFHSDDYSKLCDLAAAEFECDRDILYQILFDEDCPEKFGVAELRYYETIVRRMIQAVEMNAEWVQRLQAEVSAKERLVTAVEEDTSLEDLNLPALKSFLDSLMYHVKPVEHRITRDNFSVAVFDALVVDKDSEPLTEREQLSILLDCAQSIITESM